MAVFKARLDTINAHEGLAGKHPGRSKETFTRITEEREIAAKKMKNMSSDEKKILQKDV